MLLATTEQIEECKTEEAQNLDANATVGVRFTTSQTMSGAAEIPAYGTANRLKDCPKPWKVERMKAPEYQR